MRAPGQEGRCEPWRGAGGAAGRGRQRRALGHAGLAEPFQSAFARLTGHGQTFTGAGRAHFSGKTVPT